MGVGFVGNCYFLLWGSSGLRSTCFGEGRCCCGCRVGGGVGAVAGKLEGVGVCVGGLCCLVGLLFEGEFLGGCGGGADGL